jgi:mono/diheme cytochrome c family protein
MRFWPLFFAFVIGLLLLPIGFAVFAMAGWLPTDAVSQPPGLEVAIGERALDSSLEGRAKGLRNPIAANDNAAVLAGAKLFHENCAGCHGSANADSRWGSQNFYPRVPQFRSIEDDDVPSAEEAYVAIRDGIRYSGMGGWNGMLSERQMWDLANFLSRIHRLPPEAARAWRSK